MTSPVAASIRATLDVMNESWERRPPAEQAKLWTVSSTMRFLSIVADRLDDDELEDQAGIAYLTRWSTFIQAYVRTTRNKEPRERLCVAAMRLAVMCNELETSPEWILKGIEEA